MGNRCSRVIAKPCQQKLMFSPTDGSDQAVVLIVDDVPENLHLLSAALSQRGYEVCIATNGAIALAQIQDIMPDLVLLDILMPELDGYETCERLKANPLTQKIPVVFISAVTEIIDKVKAFQVGGVDYITKPLQLDEALARIEHQLKLRSLQKRLEAQNLQLQQEVCERKQAEQALAKLNADLEQQVQVRTAQLQLAYDFEATLKRITDRVRDSLDEHQILQTAVQELGRAIRAASCNVAVYDLSQRTSTICYEYTTNALMPFRGRVLQMNRFSEGYAQLLQGQLFQFCSLRPNPVRGQVALLACPILDQHGVLGDLWLTNQSGQGFEERDIRLVQQVANQCAIALRQARLYQAAQAQVEALEHLNRLKTDFLNTVSHELRTPMTSIRMATEMLEIRLGRANLLTQEHQLSQYFMILHSECSREIQLIDDLLDLSRLDDGNHPLSLSTLYLQDWMPQVTETFVERTRRQQQTLQFDIPITLPALTTDFSYLERVLTELLNNACKYTPIGQRIVVSASLLELDANKVFQIDVRNSGVEIPTDELTKIFDKFYRIPNNDPWKHGGTGLGLALVKKRINQLQGTIEVTSGDGWTTFMVQLPQQI